MYQKAEVYLRSSADELLDVKLWDRVRPTDISSACHLLLRYSLLDRLADAFGIPRQPSFRPAPRRILPDSAAQRFMKVSLYHHFNARLS